MNDVYRDLADMSAEKKATVLVRCVIAVCKEKCSRTDLRVHFRYGPRVVFNENISITMSAYSDI